MIQESMSLIKGPLSLCVFQLLGLSSILESVMSINFRSIFFMFPFARLSNFSNFLLVSIPTLIDQSNESNPVDSNHLLFRAWLSRFGIGKEVYYTKCLTEGHPCLVAFDYGSQNNVVSQRLVEKL